LTVLVRFGLMTVNFNSEAFYGLKGLTVLISPAPFLVLVFSTFVYLWFLCGNLILQIVISLLPDKNNTPLWRFRK